MTDQRRLDGGRNALVGFLYQIVGVSGVRAIACGLWKEDEAEVDDLAAHWGYNIKALHDWRDNNKEELLYQTGRKVRPVEYTPFDASAHERS